MPDFEDFQRGYKNLWANCELDGHRVDEIRDRANVIIKNKDRYKTAEVATGVPWFWQGCIHYRERANNFLGQLLNGQDYNKVTTIHPAGLGPWSSWEEASIFGLKRHKLDLITDWTIERCLYEAERWNGFGYFGRENSPYVWAGTTQSDEIGKFVSDGKYDPDAPEKQLGVAALLKMLIALDDEVRLELVGIPLPPIDIEEDLSGIPDKVLVKELLSRSDIHNVLINYSDSKIGVSTTETVSITTVSSPVERNNSMNSQIAGQIRHWVGIAGTVAVTFGFMTEDQIPVVAEVAVQIAGAFMMLSALISSWRAPEKQ